LNALGIPIYGRTETLAVKEKPMSPFVYMIGGSATLQEVSVEGTVGTDASVAKIGFTQFVVVT
jgi:hypothetical protein